MSRLSTEEKRALASRKSKGKRPWFYDSAETERVLNVALALAQELAVTRERMDTLERLLEAKGVLARPEFDQFMPSTAIAAERSQANQDYLARVFRVMTQNAESAGEQGAQLAASIDELARS